MIAAVKAAVPGVKVESVRPYVDPENPPSEQYVVVTTSTGRRSRPMYSGEADKADHRTRIMCVGPWAEEVQHLARKIADHLMQNRLSVTGWLCSMPEHDVSMEVERDDAVTARPLMYSIDEFAFTATRTP